MARVRVLPPIVHTSYGHQPGDEIDLPGDVAQTWCNAGLAEMVRGEAPDTPERARSAPEHAAEPESPEDGKPETAASKSRASRTRKS